jgi:hydrogenase nickel incorporation protein HypA/HybF
MHEISLMENLLEIVGDTARREDGGRVTVIHMRIGEMSGVNIDALNFAFEVLSKGTLAEGSTLECERVPLEMQCSACGADSRPKDLVFRCPLCGATEIVLNSGRELEIDYILMEEDGDKVAGRHERKG